MKNVSALMFQVTYIWSQWFCIGKH